MRKNLVVLFTGTHSTGKTTALHKVSEKLSAKHLIIAGGSRPLKEMGIINNTDAKADATDQMLINAELLMKYYEISTSDIELFIAERSPVCVFSYAKMLKDIPEYVLKFNERFLRSTFGRDDIEILTIYFPPNIPFVEDDVRVSSSRKAVDDNIKEILREYNIDYYTLDATDLDERVEVICSLINMRIINS